MALTYKEEYEDEFKRKQTDAFQGRPIIEMGTAQIVDCICKGLCDWLGIITGCSVSCTPSLCWFSIAFYRWELHTDLYRRWVPAHSSQSRHSGAVW